MIQHSKRKRRIIYRVFAFTPSLWFHIRRWQALILYLYSGDIKFLPLKSERTASQSTAVVEGDQLYQPCSPKSMYRLAVKVSDGPNMLACIFHSFEKLGLDDLKNLAFKSIRTGLSKSNILDEAFSEFTSRWVILKWCRRDAQIFLRYPPILEMEVNILSEHFNSPEVLKAFPAKFKSVAEGKLPHSSTILTSLFQKLAEKVVQA